MLYSINIIYLILLFNLLLFMFNIPPKYVQKSSLHKSKIEPYIFNNQTMQTFP